MSTNTAAKDVKEDGGASSSGTDLAHPSIVSRDQWLVERKTLLSPEKELTKHYNRVMQRAAGWFRLFYGNGKTVAASANVRRSPG